MLDNAVDALTMLWMPDDAVDIHWINNQTTIRARIASDDKDKDEGDGDGKDDGKEKDKERPSESRVGLAEGRTTATRHNPPQTRRLSPPLSPPRLES